MDIPSIWKNFKKSGEDNKNNILIFSFLFLGFLGGFGLGLLLGSGKPSPIIIDRNVKISLSGNLKETAAESTSEDAFALGNFVASINGKYYYPKNCVGAARIKEENMIWFNTAQEAENGGYKPSKSCE